MTTDSRVIQISGREVRQGGRPFLIAEVAQAHDGSLGFAHAFIEIAAQAGFDAVKFQTHIAAAESTRDEPFRLAFSYEDVSRFDYWRRMEFTASQWQGLFEHARERDLIFLSSCFSIDAVKLMRQIGMPAWKVGSGELQSDTLLDAMALDRKPVLLSTGMNGFRAIERQVARLAAANVPVGVFQCTTKYPATFDQVGLNAIATLHERLRCPVGLSDHSGSIWPSVAAMALGAPLIEVHVAMHKSQFGPDTAASLDPYQLAQVAEARNAVSQMLSNPVDKDAAEQEMASLRQLFGRSLALKESLPAGTVLRREHLTMKKPGGGFPCEDLPNLLGRRLSVDVPPDRLLRPDDFESLP
jgi:N,N'-diacetyllegionaminate synthase